MDNIIAGRHNRETSWRLFTLLDCLEGIVSCFKLNVGDEGLLRVLVQVMMIVVLTLSLWVVVCGSCRRGQLLSISVVPIVVD